MKNPSALMSFALDLATVASSDILRRFPPKRVHAKEDGSVVTDADRAAEKAMRRRIRKKYPSHRILGEEYGEVVGRDDFQWLLDPIDGTRLFTMGVPMFGTLIGLLEGGNPRAGVVHLPVSDETLFAETGRGCWYMRAGRKPVRVHVDGSVSNMKRATVSTSSIDCSELRSGAKGLLFHLGEFLREARSIEFVGGCVQHLLVAKGDLHVGLDAEMYPWDIAAFVPCIREAGGVVSTLDGDYDNVVFGGSLLSSCNRQLHEEVVRLLNRNEN